MNKYFNVQTYFSGYSALFKEQSNGSCGDSGPRAKLVSIQVFISFKITFEDVVVFQFCMPGQSLIVIASIWS